VFFFKDGIARFALEKYSNSNINFNDKKAILSHLTNYSLIKNLGFHSSRNIEDTLEHCKKPLEYVIEHIDLAGHDTEELMQGIYDIITKTIISIHPKLLHNYNTLQPRSKEHDMCFEILGFDIFIDSSLKPWLIEVNHMPSFNQDTDVDKTCKQGVIRGTLMLLNVNSRDKRRKVEHSRKNRKGKYPFDSIAQYPHKIKRDSVETMIANGLKFKNKKDKYEKEIINKSGFKLISHSANDVGLILINRISLRCDIKLQPMNGSARMDVIRILVVLKTMFKLT
jgi:tubulin polyglutamylase TTLL6/13